MGGYDQQIYGKPCSTNVPSTGVNGRRPNSDFTYKVVCGGIVCDRDFAIYDISGRDVTSQNGSLSGLYILKVGAVAKKVIVAQ